MIIIHDIIHLYGLSICRLLDGLPFLDRIAGHVMLNTNNKSWHHSAFETLQQAGLSILTMFRWLSFRVFTTKNSEIMLLCKYFFQAFYLQEQRLCSNLALSNFSKEKPSIACHSCDFANTRNHKIVKATWINEVVPWRSTRASLDHRHSPTSLWPMTGWLEKKRGNGGIQNECQLRRMLSLVSQVVLNHELILQTYHCVPNKKLRRWHPSPLRSAESPNKKRSGVSSDLLVWWCLWLNFAQIAVATWNAIQIQLEGWLLET